MILAIEDDDLDACAAELCEVFLDLIVKPLPLIRDTFTFFEINEDGREVYRELALAVIQTLRNRL